ncbi:hypothetical protein DL96DRAFT_717102 [Flagelloscypha sp. PMI_526]|nr:hypothetical protein DL96DRAFT_717102 [Flagelloscypha sp. PMI_526]
MTECWLSVGWQSLVVVVQKQPRNCKLSSSVGPHPHAYQCCDQGYAKLSPPTERKAITGQLVCRTLSNSIGLGLVPSWGLVLFRIGERQRQLPFQDFDVVQRDFKKTLRRADDCQLIETPVENLEWKISTKGHNIWQIKIQGVNAETFRRRMLYAKDDV